MEVVMLPISEIKPYEKNPRIHPKSQIRKLAKSIESFGFHPPVELDTENVIIAGHGRYLAAKELGLEEIPCVVRDDLTERLARARRIADNKTAEGASWIDEFLQEEVQILRDEEMEIEAISDLIAFDREEVEELLGITDGGGSGKGVDGNVPVTAELMEKWKVERGQLWSGGGHRLLCGDATNGEDVDRLLAGETPKLMITDPPYGISYDPDWRNEAAAKGQIRYAAKRNATVANDEVIDWGDALQIFKGDVVYLWHGVLKGSVTARMLERMGYEIRAQIVWRKEAIVISRGHYNWQHETCWYAVRKGARADWIGSKGESTVWDITRKSDDKENFEHGTQKPVECMLRAIRNHEGDVYDPFIGTGTTMVASQVAGRRCYGMELESKWIAVSLERMERLGVEMKQET